MIKLVNSAYYNSRICGRCLFSLSLSLSLSTASPPPTKTTVSPGVVSVSPQPLFTVGSSSSQLHRPGPLEGLKQPTKLHTSHDVAGSNSPGSPGPNVTVTPAEEGNNRQLSLQYDSGKDSMPCSDHSNGSETQPDLIKLDSEQQQQLLRVSSGYHPEFDPLLSITQSTSNDSLFDPQPQSANYKVSPTPIPLPTTQQQQQWGTAQYTGTPMQRQGSGSSATSTSPKSFSQLSPKQSSTDSGIVPSPSIIRPRPKAMNLPPVPAPPMPISAPSSRPPSPRPRKSSRRNTSPTPSVESMRTYRYDSDPGWNYLSDSDATSTSSSLLDVRYGDDEDPNPTILPNMFTSDDFDFFNPSAPMHMAFLNQQK